MVSSRVHARRGSVEFESKASNCGWFTGKSVLPSAAGQDLTPIGRRDGCSFPLKILTRTVAKEAERSGCS